MKKVNWKKGREVTVNLTKSIIRGEIVLKLDRFLPHILVAALVSIVCIYAILKFDNTLVQREDNRKELEMVKIAYSQKVCQLAEVKQVNNIGELLESKGLDITSPKKPATIIRKK